MKVAYDHQVLYVLYQRTQYSMCGKPRISDRAISENVGVDVSIVLDTNSVAAKFVRDGSPLFYLRTKKACGWDCLYISLHGIRTNW